MFDTLSDDYTVEEVGLAAPAERRAGLIERLERLPAGPQLGRVLAGIDVRALRGRQRIAVLQAQQRMVSHHQAGLYASMAAVVEHMREHDDDHSSATEAAAAEIGVALRLTRRATENEVTFALDLDERLPQVRGALEAGAIDRRRAWAMIIATSHLPDETAREVVDRVVEVAPKLTTGQLFARLRKLCIEVNPAEAKERYRHAVEERRVVAEPTTDGTMNLLGLDLQPHLAAKAMSRINSLARANRGGGEDRTMDQLRADVLLDLLLGEAADAGTTVIDLQVSLDTLAGADDRTGDLGGYGPVVADIARQIADDSPNAEWRFTVTDPETGRQIGNGTTRRRPNAGLRREVHARNRTCVFPGCRMPAISSDVDHRVRYADGGPTTVGNLGPLCRFHHGVKHGHGWTYEPIGGGDFRWRTKLGLTYTTSGAPP